MTATCVGRHFEGKVDLHVNAYHEELLMSKEDIIHESRAHRVLALFSTAYV